MIPFKEVHVLDRNAEYYGVPTNVLMENAGSAVARAAIENFDIKGKKILILCGTGNNGGDGFVAARELAGFCNVNIILLRPPENIRTKLSREQYETAIQLERIKFQLLEHVDILAEIGGSELLIDAMLGIGITGEVRDPYSGAISAVNNSDVPVLSVDLPSGLGTDNTVKADATVTFHDMKEGMSEDTCGRIIVADIGIPEQAEIFTGPGEFVYYPVPKPDWRKGENGKLLIIGGGPYTGAPSMAAMAAYRTGADLVPIAVPERIFDVIASHSSQFIVKPLPGERLGPGNVETCLELAKGSSAVLIGPGLGDAQETLDAAKQIIECCTLPIVIDADALKAVAQDSSIVKNKICVLTPHRGEFRLLGGKDATPEGVTEMAKALGVTVLLKGKVDIISDGNRVKQNKFGNSGMTVGGTGDVLAGAVGALLSKGCEPFNAARLGALLIGISGNLAYAGKSYGLMASDIIEQIPNVLVQHLRISAA